MKHSKHQTGGTKRHVGHPRAHYSGTHQGGKDRMQHADHAYFNKEHGLPHDVFGHDGEDYGNGHGGAGTPIQEDNYADMD